MIRLTPVSYRIEQDINEHVYHLDRHTTEKDRFRWFIRYDTASHPQYISCKDGKWWAAVADEDGVDTPEQALRVWRKFYDPTFVGSNDEVIAHFEEMGYKVSWDGNRLSGIWHEIYDSDGLYCQIDRGVPLADILRDLKCYANDQTPADDGGKNYSICLDNSSKSKLFLEKFK